MKLDTSNLLTITAGAVVAFLAVQILKRRTAAGAATPAAGGAGYATQIETLALPGQAGWGWQYFTDGTAIGPDGAYYHNGVKVWTPSA
jgi:hypothetical protein